MKNNIELQNVSKTYKDFKLQDISFNVPEGCIVGLIGENRSRENHNNKVHIEYNKIRRKHKNIRKR